MKKLVLLFTLIMSTNISFSQERMEGLRYDNTKFSIGINVPNFGVSTYMYNVRNKWGGFISVLYAGGPGKEDDNYISPYHELTDDYLVNHRGGSVGLMYRIWRPFHFYAGVGLGWGTRQLIYRDTPPIVLEDAYRTSFDGIKPLAHFGIQLTWWRIAIGTGYNTYIKAPEFFIGYVVKFNPE